MATHLSNYFWQRRLQLNLRVGDVVRRMGYRSIFGVSNKIVMFEETGDIPADLFKKMAAVLSIDEPTIQRLMERDWQDFVEEWDEWADQPIQPHLVIRAIPGVFIRQSLPDGMESAGDMERYATGYAKERHKKVWLVLSRRLTVFYDEDGVRKAVQRAVPGKMNSPYMQVLGCKQKFLFGGGLEMQPLTEPQPHGPMVAR
jgi:hypothetical protein